MVDVLEGRIVQAELMEDERSGKGRAWDEGGKGGW